jgi:DNA (cytosine-5)-methyltransferase 1
VLFAEDHGPHEPRLLLDSACGFYWTEGLRGLGWAVDAVPTLKGGSSVGIPSPPGVWRRGVGDGPAIITPDVRDAERLQGFAAGWTEPAVEDPRRRNGPRWKLVGNAVSVPVARWLGDRLAYNRDSEPHAADRARPLAPNRASLWGSLLYVAIRHAMGGPKAP